MVLRKREFPSGVMFTRFRPQAGRLALPDVCCDLVWVHERLTLVGPTSRGEAIPWVGADVQLMNIDPLVARAWLGVPLIHFVDRHIALSDIDKTASSILSHLFAWGRAVELVRQHRTVPPAQTRAVAAARILRSGLSVRRTARLVGWSERQLERVFADQFGLSPRCYRRVLRMRRAVQAVGTGKSLALAAVDEGYSDQPHFTREVRALMGYSPREVIPHVGKIQDAIACTRHY